jgi:hypothetical protein
MLTTETSPTIIERFVLSTTCFTSSVNRDVLPSEEGEVELCPRLSRKHTTHLHHAMMKQQQEATRPKYCSNKNRLTVERTYCTSSNYFFKIL